MAKIKFWLIYLYKIFSRKKKNFLILTILALILVATFLKFIDSRNKQTVTEAIVGTFTEQNLPDTVNSLLSKGLIKTDESGKPVPDLVSEWQVSEDGKVYTFKLQDNLFWADGTKVKSSEIAIAVPDVEISTPDDTTIQFKLSDSFSPFPSLLKKPIFKKGTNIGVGPYKIAQIKKDQIFVSKVTLQPVDKNLPDIIIRFYPNENIAKNALRIGEVQSVIGVSEISDLTKEKTFSLYSKTNYQQLVTIFYNTRDPILSDENFRLALSYAAPSLKGETEAKTSIPPISWAFNSQVKDFLDNPEQAKSSLSKVKNGRDSVITLTATTSLKNVGERVVEAWKSNGINVVLRIESGIPQNFQALLIAQNIPADPDQYSLWHSTQTHTNISRFSSPRVDKDLEDGRKVQDPEIRKQRYQDFQKALLDDAPATFLYFPKYNVIYMKRVEPQIKKVLDIQFMSI